MARDDHRFRPRSATLTRRVECGFVAGTLGRASERFYLRLVSTDQQNPGFTTGTELSNRFYLVCEGSAGLSMETFVPGTVLTYALNSFTLPCTYHIYPVGIHDPLEASRITGIHGFRMRSATLHVLDGVTLDDQAFDIAIDVVVESLQGETLALRGHVIGDLSTSATVVNCPTERRNTKQEPHPACPP